MYSKRRKSLTEVPTAVNM